MLRHRCFCISGVGLFYSPARQHGALATARGHANCSRRKHPVRVCEGVIAAAMDDYRSAFAVAQSHPWSRVPRPQPPGDVRLAPCAEIGIGLTGAGLLFMLLGMMMFFDKGLLAMGNVRRVLSGPRLHIAATVLTVAASASADPVPFGRDDDHRHQQDLPLLLPEAQAQRWEPPERAHSRLATSPLASHPALPSHPALACRQARRASWAASGWCCSAGPSSAWASRLQP